MTQSPNGALQLLQWLICLTVAMLIVHTALPTTGFSKELPTWIQKTPTDSHSLYIVGLKANALSLEEGRRDAAGNGVKELIAYLGLRIQSKFELVQTELETRVRDELKAMSEQVEVKGALIKAWHFEQKPSGSYDVYVLLQFPREAIEKEQARLARLMTERAILAQKGIKQGEEAERRGDAVSAMTTYLMVIKAATGDEVSKNALAHVKATRRLESLIRRLHLEVVSGDGQRAEAFRGPEEPLIVKAVLAAESGDVPVPRLPIRYRWLSGDDAFPCVSRTDERGLASCHITRLNPLAKEVRVQAEIDAERLMQLPLDMKVSDRQAIAEMVELLKTRVVEFTLSSFVERKDLKVAVVINEENLGVRMERSLVGSAIAEKLAEAGYQVVDDQKIAQIVVTGTSTTRVGVATSGLDVITSRADGLVRAIETDTETVVAQKRLVNIAGFGLTTEQAGLDGLKRISGPLAEAIREQLLSIER